LEENNQKRKELQQQYNAAEKANEQHQESIDKRHMILEEILAFQLPKHIKELKLKDIKGIRYVLDNERRKQLSEFEERYKAASMQMQLCQEEILKQEKVAEEIEEICKKSIRAMNVEEIQDEVEDQIMQEGAYQVARVYITYRYKRQLVRQSNTTDAQIMTIIESQN